MTAGQKLRALRKSKGVTVAHLARVLGINRNRLYAIETDRVRVRLEDFTRICKAYGADAKEFLNGNGEGAKNV